MRAENISRWVAFMARRFNRGPAARRCATSCERKRVALAGALTAFATSSLWAADENNQPGAAGHAVELAEVIVTTNRYSQNMQNVPVSVVAVTADQVQRQGVGGTPDLAAVIPGLTMSNGNAGLQIHLRGIGTSSISTGQENSVATYIDGVYVASMNAAILQFNSISQIEVDKGPQGTLFGRNATGGVIEIKTKDPTQAPGGDFSVGYGNYQTVSTNGYITGGIASNLAADLALYYSDQAQGFGRNLLNGADVEQHSDIAARSKWLFTPTDVDRLVLVMDFERSNNTVLGSYHALPGYPTNWGPGAPPFGQPYLFPGGPWDVSYPSVPDFSMRQGGLALTYDRDWDAVHLTNISAYRRSDTISSWNAQPIPVAAEPVYWDNKEQSITEELRLSAPAGSKIGWVAGVFYLNDYAKYDPFTISGLYAAPAPLSSITFLSDEKADSKAVFGQATIPMGFLADTNLTAGLRYTSERRKITGETLIDFLPPIPELVSGITDASKTFSKVTWRWALDHRFSDSVLGYVSYNRGFKSGVYNTIPAGGPDAKPVSPEVLDAYELGVKTDLLDRRLRLNAAAFFYDYSQIQVTVFTPTSAVLENGAKAQVYGLDFDFEAQLTSNLRITGGAVLLNDKFTSFPLAQYLVPQSLAAGGGNLSVGHPADGNELNYTPKYTGNVGLDYLVPLGSSGNLDFNVTYAYSSGWFAGPDNILRSPISNLVNAQATWQLPDTRTSVQVWAKNLANEAVPMQLVAGANPGGYNQGSYNPPRTYGLTLRYRF